MVEVGRIEATVTADSTNFVRGMRKAEQATVDVEGRLSATQAGFLKLGASIGTITSSFGFFVRDVATVVGKLVELQEALALEQSVARALGLARREYNQLALALTSTGQERDEIRDLLSDLQEVLALASRGEERELDALTELGFSAELAALGVDELDQAFIKVLRRVAELDRITARGILTELFGGDAARRYIEIASDLDRFLESYERVANLSASDSSVEGLNEFAQAVRESREAWKEAAIELLDVTGVLRATTVAQRNLLEIVTNTSTKVGAAAAVLEAFTDRSLFDVASVIARGGRGLGQFGLPTEREFSGNFDERLGRLASSLERIAGISSELAEETRATLERQFVQLTRFLLEQQEAGRVDVTLSPELLPSLRAFSDQLSDAGREGAVLDEALRRLTESSDETSRRLALAAEAADRAGEAQAAAEAKRAAAAEAEQAERDRLIALEESRRTDYLKALEAWFSEEIALRRAQEDARNAALNAANDQLLMRIRAAEEAAAEAQRDTFLVAAFGAPTGGARAEALADAEAEAEARRLQQVATLTTAFSAFFAQAQADITDLGSAFEAFVRSILNSLIAEATGSLVAGLFSGAPTRQFGGPVSAGRVYETHGLGRREFFVPAQDGTISTQAGPAITINVASGVNESGLRRFAHEEMVPIIERIVRGSLLDYNATGRVP